MVSKAPEWATRSGDVWAARWRDADRALSGIAPALHAAILAAAPAFPFSGFDVSCGPGSTTLDLARSRPDARIVACDVSPTLAGVAGKRLADMKNVEMAVGDAQVLAAQHGPFDLIYSRHGVMFFPDPVFAFKMLRQAASDGGSLVFSCFDTWEANIWASELAAAAAGHAIAAPGREPSGFAFAEPDYVRSILNAAGWTCPNVEAVSFSYVAGQGDHAVEQALSFLCAIGPAAREIELLDDKQRDQGVERMRRLIERKHDGGGVQYEAAAWIWTARA